MLRIELISVKRKSSKRSSRSSCRRIESRKQYWSRSANDLRRLTTGVLSKKRWA